MATTSQQAETLARSLEDMLMPALGHLRDLAASMTSDGEEDENGFPSGWELAQRYYRAREALAEFRGAQPHDTLFAGDDCRWARARRDAAE